MTSKHPTPKAVAEACRAVAPQGLDIGPAQAEGLAAYLALLAKWNKVMNLVGKSDWQTMVRELIADCLHLAAFVRGLALPEAPVTFDLGAGAGLPGIPLRLFWDAGEYTMVEARGKRAVFLQTALAQLPCTATRVYSGRAEDAARKLGTADVVVSRAFMPWEKLLGFVREAPLLAPGGTVLFMANEPPPALPDGWELAAHAAYAVAGRERFFWAVASA